MPRTLTQLRAEEAAAVTRTLDQALAAINAAELRLGCWADTIRRETEERLDLPEVEHNEQILYDPAYGAALDHIGRILRARDAVADACDYWHRQDTGGEPS